MMGLGKTVATKKYVNHQNLITAAGALVAAAQLAAGAAHAAADGSIAASDPSHQAIVSSGKNAIVGSGKNAIVGSGKNAIVGSGKNAIVGSGKNAIVGSGKNAIVGSGKNAIVGSGKNAIVGSGKNAIVGSGKNAIVGSGKNAIVGSGKNAIVGSGKNAIVGSGKQTNDSVFGVVLAGPLESLDVERGTALVLGQEVAISAATQVGSGLEIGDEVVVTGMAGENQFFASTLSESGNQYVAGASDVFVAGYVSNVDGSIGQISVGNATFDITSVGNMNVAPGDYVEISGIQPLAGGKVLAASVGN